MLIGAGCGDSRESNGKYVSVIHLPGSGEEWTETIEFEPNGICYYGSSANSRRVQMITAWEHDRNLRKGVVLNQLQYDGNQLVDP